MSDIPSFGDQCTVLADGSRRAGNVGKGAARAVETTDHADGRYVAGTTISRNAPVLVQRQTGDGLECRTDMAKTAEVSSHVALPPVAAPPMPAASPVGESAPAPVYVPAPVAPPAHIPAPVHQAAPVQMVKTKRKVTISGGGIGRMTIFAADIIVNDSIIALVYPNDGSTAIVEPPPTDPANPVPITFEIDGKKYDGLCRELKFERGNELTLIFIRC